MRSIIAMVACVALILCASSMVFADQEAEVKDLVNKAIQTFSGKGTDYTLRLISSSSGPFRKGEIYVYVMSLDGVMLAHPVNKDLVGKSQEDTKDAKGMPINAALRAPLQKEEEGWAEYWWLRHGEKEPTLKRTFVKQVPGEKMFVAAGYYVTK